MLELLLVLQRNLQRAICGCEQQWGVISLRLRRVDIVVEREGLLQRLVEQVMLLLKRRRRRVVVVEVVKALVRVLAWVGRIGDDGLHLRGTLASFRPVWQQAKPPFSSLTGRRAAAAAGDGRARLGSWSLNPFVNLL